MLRRLLTPPGSPISTTVGGGIQPILGVMEQERLHPSWERGLLEDAW